MSFTKITQNDTNGKGVVGLPDAPGLAAGDMQKKFDELATDVIIPKFNQLSTELDNMQIGTELTYNQWNALTEAQKANGDYYITDYPDEFAKAVNIPIDAISGMSANNVQNGLNELKSAFINNFISDNKRTKEYQGDLNDILENSIYNLASGHVSHLPSGHTSGWYFIVTVMWANNNTFGEQTLLPMNATQSMWFRTLVNGTWGDWQKLAIDEPITQVTMTPCDQYNTLDYNDSYKKGNIVDFQIVCHHSANIPTSEWWVLMTNISNKPIYIQSGIAFTENGHLAIIKISPDGNLYARCIDGYQVLGGEQLRVHLTYLCN